MNALKMLRKLETVTAEGRADTALPHYREALGKCQCPSQWLCEIAFRMHQKTLSAAESSALHEEECRARDMLCKVSQQITSIEDYWNNIEAPRSMRLDIIRKAAGYLEMEVTTSQ